MCNIAFTAKNYLTNNGKLNDVTIAMNLNEKSNINSRLKVLPINAHNDQFDRNLTFFRVFHPSIIFE